MRYVFLIRDVRRSWTCHIYQISLRRSHAELKSVGVVVVEESCAYLGVGLAEVDTAHIYKAMELDLTALSIGEGDVPVRICANTCHTSKRTQVFNSYPENVAGYWIVPASALTFSSE